MTDASDAGHDGAYQACRELEEAVRRLQREPLDEMTSGDLGRLICRIRKTRREVARYLADGDTLGGEARTGHVLQALENVNTACGDASIRVDSALETVHCALAELNDKLHVLDSYGATAHAESRGRDGQEG